MRISDWSSDVCSSDLLGKGGVACSIHAGGTILSRGFLRVLAISPIPRTRRIVQNGAGTRRIPDTLDTRNVDSQDPQEPLFIGPPAPYTSPSAEDAAHNSGCRIV